MRTERKNRIMKQLQAYIEVQERCKALEKELSGLGVQLSKLESSLYRDRSKEHIADTLECLREAMQKNDNAQLKKLSLDVQKAYDLYDIFIEERLMFATDAEKKRLQEK
ncbi:MAG: hypothetical protein H6Q52_1094 [Deltaproteobacteria bacterium]|nr:hypothetical protein [Deltaproteobacteria bacterium]